MISGLGVKRGVQPVTARPHFARAARIARLVPVPETDAIIPEKVKAEGDEPDDERISPDSAARVEIERRVPGRCRSAKDVHAVESSRVPPAPSSRRRGL
jgi:hypothetical protein